MPAAFCCHDDEERSLLLVVVVAVKDHKEGTKASLTLTLAVQTRTRKHKKECNPIVSITKSEFFQSRSVLLESLIDEDLVVVCC